MTGFFYTALVAIYLLGVYNKLMKKDKEKLINRLKRMEGQLRGIKEMVEKDSYCIAVITQTSALRGALGSLEDKLMEEHLSCCVTEQVKKGQSKKIRDEVMKVYKLVKKK
ncbi:MAG: DNA-binding FrmR family transcriptional regulator [Candidatus Paceibacteria bacterium]